MSPWDPKAGETVYNIAFFLLIVAAIWSYLTW